VPVLAILGLVRAVALLRRGTGATWRDAVGAFFIWQSTSLVVARASVLALFAKKAAFLRTGRVGFQVDDPWRVAGPDPRRPAARIAHFPGVMRPPGGSPLAAARRCPRALSPVTGAIATETRDKARTLGCKPAHPGHRTAIEPVVREALRRISDQLPGQPQAIGGYWTRTNDPKVDLIGADREPVAKQIAFVGSIKWRDNQPFDERDLADLVTHRSQVPGAAESTPLVAVTRSGTRVTTPLVLGPENLLSAWS
jgi:hypothetical protein